MSAEFSNQISLQAEQASVIFSDHPSLKGIQWVLKRGLDIVLSCLSLFIFFPLLLVVPLLIKLDSPGPVFFKQKRVGLNGREFWIYKFRSMSTDAESRLSSLRQHNEIKDGVIFKMTNDPRVTRLGSFLRKTSIDELPQLINVLRGDMSLIGPRPLPTYEVAMHAPQDLKRLEVLPGVTGLWQVSGRSQIDSFKKMVELDIEYINHWSLGFDIKILFKTIQVVVFAKGSC